MSLFCIPVAAARTALTRSFLYSGTLSCRVIFSKSARSKASNVIVTAVRDIKVPTKMTDQKE
jgi:hypothetical protein